MKTFWLCNKNILDSQNKQNIYIKEQVNKKGSMTWH